MDRTNSRSSFLNSSSLVICRVNTSWWWTLAESRTPGLLRDRFLSTDSTVEYDGAFSPVERMRTRCRSAAVTPCPVCIMQRSLSCRGPIMCIAVSAPWTPLEQPYVLLETLDGAKGILARVRHGVILIRIGIRGLMLGV